ncbi:hypothetical protein [Streptomyces sp. NPDC049915]|uniref:hypothetical protein n=1 Tax=Streptomyces sp. NPDC049915 TaxID=3155510 RepID=UPI00343A7505
MNPQRATALASEQGTVSHGPDAKELKHTLRPGVPALGRGLAVRTPCRGQPSPHRTGVCQTAIEADSNSKSTAPMLSMSEQIRSVEGEGWVLADMAAAAVVIRGPASP